MAERYVLNALAAGASTLGGLTSQSYAFNGSVLRPVTDGGADAGFSALSGAAPVMEFTTHDVAAAITALGLLGSDLDDLSGGLKMQFRQQGPVGAESGTVHHTITAAAGVAYPTTLTVAQGQLAAISYRIVPVSSDGSTLPVTRTAATLTALSALFSAGYTIGAVKLGGTAIASPVSATLDFGISHVADVDSGLPYPQFVALESRTPTLTVEHRDAAISLPASLSGNGCELFLRRMQNGSVPYGDAAAQHGLLTIAEGTIHDGGASSGGFIADLSFQVHGTKPSSAAVLAWATGQAISA